MKRLRPRGAAIHPRLRASLVHLLVTLPLLGALVPVVLALWYPPPYLRILGAGQILTLVISAGVVIGPVLTFVVYRPGKKGLKFDLVVIAVAQLTALAYGTLVLYEERPYFMVFAVDRFNVLARKDVDFSAIERPEFRRKPQSGPLRLIATMPRDLQARQRLMEETLFLGLPDLDRRPQYWSAWESGYREVVGRSALVDRLTAARPGAAEAVEKIAARAGVDTGDLVFVPVMGKRDDFAVIVDAAGGEILGAVAVNPWLE